MPAVQVGDRLARAILEQHVVGVEELERDRDDGIGEDVHGGARRRSGGTRAHCVGRECANCSAAPSARRYNRPMAASTVPRRSVSAVRRWAASPRRRSSGAIGRRQPLLVRARDRRVHRAFQRARAVRARRARRRRVAPRRARRRPLVARARSVPARAISRTLPARDWTLLVQGVNLRRRRGRRAAAPLRVPAVRAPRRPDGELRGAGRRRRSALRLLRRVPAAGLRPAPLALRRASDDLALRARACRSRSCGTSRPRTTRCSRPATCSTCRRSIAHDGVAIDACTTYSIGFRAPRRDRSSRAAFLDFLRDELELAGTLRRSRPVARRASRRAIGAAMQRRYLRLAASICAGTARRSRASSARTCPSRRPHVFFDPPTSPLSRAAFRGRVATRGVDARPAHAAALRRRALYVNGDARRRGPRRVARALRRLANAPRCSRRAAARALSPDAALAILHDWYRDGYLHPGDA